MNEDSAVFLANLHNEKLKHKQHRVEFVKSKLLFTIGLFSVGSIQIQYQQQDYSFTELLFFVPLVALAYDIYIFAEDFKVKRIGIFILEYFNPSYEERNWEVWLSAPRHRERYALIASVLLTIITFLASFIIIYTVYRGEGIAARTFVIGWVVFVSILSSIVFSTSIISRNELIDSRRNRLSLNSLRFRTGFLIAALFVGLVWLFFWLFSQFKSGFNIYETILLGYIIAVWIIVMFTLLQEYHFRRLNRFCNTTFNIKVDDAREVYLCGDFTRWETHKIRLNKNNIEGVFEVTILMQTGMKYEYKFLVMTDSDIKKWVLDDENGVSKTNDTWNQNSTCEVLFTEEGAIKDREKYFKNLYS